MVLPPYFIGKFDDLFYRLTCYNPFRNICQHDFFIKNH